MSRESKRAVPHCSQVNAVGGRVKFSLRTCNNKIIWESFHELRRAGEEGEDRLVHNGGDEDSDGDDERKKGENLRMSAAVASKISRHRYSNFSFKEAMIEALELFYGRCPILRKCHSKRLPTPKGLMRPTLKAEMVVPPPLP
jgi:hypothetical protein